MSPVPYTLPADSGVNAELYNSGYTYPEYIDLTDRLLAQGKTTGPNQSEAMVEYTKLNRQRIARLNKTPELRPELVEAVQQLPEGACWLVIAEPWCGDVAQNLPHIYRLSQENAGLEVRILLRDEHPELMERYLTDAGKAIPIVVALNPDYSVQSIWGPRPLPAQELVREWKATPEAERPPYPQLAEKLHGWYAKDRTQTLQDELLVWLESQKKAQAHIA